MTSPQDNMQPRVSRRAEALRGAITVPGDKSISHRALMLSSLALGTTEIHGLLEGEDVLRTAEALKQCGVSVTRSANGVWTVKGLGIGGLHAPTDVLDMGNAGTAARLLMGLLSTYPYTVHFTGDESLRKRPMQRVITPLEVIGARFQSRDGGRLPIAMTGTAMPLPISYTLPVASAQVKSAIMLAGLNAPGETTVIEKEATRDHTERMLRFFGVDVKVEAMTDSSTHRGEAGRGAATKRSLKIESAVKNAKALRKNMTDAEQLLWEILRKEQLGVKFRKQHPIGKYIADFASLENKLIIELDGGQHNDEPIIEKDKERTKMLEATGFHVLRFWNNEVLENPEGVVETILDKIENPRIGGSPPPNLPPMGGGTKITLKGQPTQTYQDRTLTVPADPSSAAFPIVAALLVPGSDVTITNVCLNPLRTGLFEVLKRMGANLTISNEREVGGEPVGDITAKHSALNAVDVEAEIAPSMIDEYPILAIAAACAKGTSIMRGLSELRVKESDRLAAIIAGLVANGVDAKAEDDTLIVTGNGKAPKGGGTVTTHFDHRIAMSFFILGLLSDAPVTVDDTRAIATSFPDFMALMQRLGVNIG